MNAGAYEHPEPKLQRSAMSIIMRPATHPSSVGAPSERHGSLFMPAFFLAPISPPYRFSGISHYFYTSLTTPT